MIQEKQTDREGMDTQVGQVHRVHRARRSGMLNRGCHRMRVRGKWGIRKGSYLSYDLGVTRKTSVRGKEDGEGRGGGRGDAQRSARASSSQWPLLRVRRFGKPLPTCPAEPGCLDEEEPQGNNPGPCGPQLPLTQECGVLKCAPWAVSLGHAGNLVRHSAQISLIIFSHCTKSRNSP